MHRASADLAENDRPRRALTLVHAVIDVACTRGYHLVTKVRWLA